MTTCYADSPLPPPEPITICSPSKEYCVDFAPGNDAIAFQIGKNGQKREVWRVKGWQRVAFVSDDGKHLAACYGGQNLIPQDYSPELVMVSIFEEGKLRHEIHLKDLIAKFSALQKTVSHFNWGNCAGLSEDRLLRVNTVENRELLIDLQTGGLSGK